MSFVRIWCCAHCGAKHEVPITADEFRAEGNTSTFDMALPAGWVWHKYKSINRPDDDTRILGCSPEHAKLAAARFEVPEWALEGT